MILRSVWEKNFVQAVGLVSLLCLALFFVRVAVTGTWHYWFIPENLVLAWVSLVFAWLLVDQLKQRRWLSWQNIALSILWLVFLPHGWYVLTDFIHVYPSAEISQLYDIVMMSSLVVCGFILAFTSLYLVHQQLRQRLGSRISAELVAAIILLSSFAIYLGRDLRWNSWDVITNPSGLILNVSDRLLDPLGHPRALNVTALFFLLISTIYLAIWILLPPSTTKKSS
jgi:uncharacterized membrane protein